jgi:glycosyltransferase involved in cell wall biosynthesis
METHWAPAPVTLLSALLHVRTPLPLDELDAVLFDRWIARIGTRNLRPGDIFLGAASSSLASGLAAQRRGAVYVLDRACPDIRFQKKTLAQEAKQAHAIFRNNAEWFVRRQVAEYEAADAILVPSEYSRRSFPESLQSKIIIAPLMGRVPPTTPPQERLTSRPFTFGVVGGDPLRKGYLHLLRAWQQAALPDARLRIRCSVSFQPYPAISGLLQQLRNVELVGYQDDMSSFYRSCDAFVLPSVDEGFGMALMEALAHGLPSIATEACGAAELLTPGRDLMVVPPGDPAALAAAMLRLYHEPEMRARLAVSAQTAIGHLQLNGLPAAYDEAIEKLQIKLRFISA